MSIYDTETNISLFLSSDCNLVQEVYFRLISCPLNSLIGELARN